VAEPTRGMGRGLAAILASTATAPEAAPEAAARDSELQDVPVDRIVPNPNQPRRHFDEAALVALSSSLTERGVLQPVLVRPLPDGDYELVAGERRWRAAQLAGLETVPALVRAHDDAASLEVALIENMAREDLNPVEEARACALLVDELGLTREDIGRRVGRSRAAVSNLMRLLDLPDEILELIAEGRLTEGHGRAILMTPDHGDRRRLGRNAAAEGWNVRQTEAAARAEVEPTPERPQGSGAVVRHPDQLAAVSQVGEAFGRALGAPVKVSPRGTGYRVSVSFETLDEALALAGRIDPQRGS
jgi:ParB family transcriptional regulator, chromosome partitioning protein